MLGRKPQGDKRVVASVASGRSRGATSAAKGGASKKRKWQEESDGDSSDEPKITTEDMEKFRKTLAEEEKQEQLERQKQEREERERERVRKEKEDAEQKIRDEEEAHSMLEADLAKKAALEADNQRRQEEITLAPPGALPPDAPAAVPPGVKADKVHLYKTTTCKRWDQGNCHFGPQCHFAHGERDLRRVLPMSSRGIFVPPTPLPQLTPEEQQMLLQTQQQQQHQQQWMMQQRQLQQQQQQELQQQHFVQQDQLLQPHQPKVIPAPIRPPSVVQPVAPHVVAPPLTLLTSNGAVPPGVPSWLPPQPSWLPAQSGSSLPQQQEWQPEWQPPDWQQAPPAAWQPEAWPALN